MYEIFNYSRKKGKPPPKVSEEEIQKILNSDDYTDCPSQHMRLPKISCIEFQAQGREFCDGCLMGPKMKEELKPEYCLVPKCPKLAKIRGLCHGHYQAYMYGADIGVEPLPPKTGKNRKDDTWYKNKSKELKDMSDQSEDRLQPGKVEFIPEVEKGDLFKDQTMHLQNTLVIDITQYYDIRPALTEEGIKTIRSAEYMALCYIIRGLKADGYLEDLKVIDL